MTAAALFVKSHDRVAVFRRVIAEIDAYRAVVERAGHKNEFSISSTDVAAHWHKHFKDDASSSDRVLNDQAVCFFQIASGANLGSVVIGRKGKATRFEFVVDAVRQFLDSEELDNSTLSGDTLETEAEVPEPKGGFPQGNQVNLSRAGASPTQLGQAIFIAHGKNKKPLEQLKKFWTSSKFHIKLQSMNPTLVDPSEQRSEKLCRAATAPSCFLLPTKNFRRAQV